MNINLLAILLIVFMTMSSSVILLKFWMDFKLSVWDRKNGVITKQFDSFAKRRFLEKKSSNKLYNKKKSEDIIIDCEVEVINSREHVHVQRERLLK